MKILYLTASFPFGYREVFFVPELQELRRRGHDVLIVPVKPRGALCNIELNDNNTVAVSTLSLTVITSAVLEFLVRPRQAWSAIAPLLAEGRILVRLKNLAVCPKALWLARLARSWRAEHIHAHWAGTSSSVAMAASRLLRVPWSLTAHRWDILENNLLKTKMRSASFTRFISKDGLELARSAGAVGYDAKTVVLHLGVNVPAQTCHFSPTSRVTMCVATLIPRKGHVFLIEAIEVLASRGIYLSVWLAGSGPYESKIRRAVNQAGLQHQLHMLGEVPNDGLRFIYASGAVAVVVLPSLHEGIPVALMEAMSFGVPVVAADVGGVSELVNGGGLLVPPGNPAALANALHVLFADPAFRADMGREARRTVERNFDSSVIVSTLLTYMEAALPQ